MDRLARDLMASLWLEKELLRAGVEVVSVAEPFRGQDAANVLFRQIIGAFAQFEKARITERMTGGRKLKAKAGGYAGGGAPMGYRARRGTKAIDIDADKANTVRRVFELREQNPGASLRALADMLNTEGHTTAQGARFSAVQVMRTLRRRDFYQGGYTYAGVTAQGQHEALI
jgi:DNA invertase Pin-like site-specific DNA recombinase